MDKQELEQCGIEKARAKANEFNTLIEQGWAKPRGYNLQIIDEVRFPHPFNEGI